MGSKITMISTRVHNKGKFINEFMFCATELKTFRTFHRWQNYNMINLVFGTQDTMTVPFLFQMTKYVFFPDETTRLSLL